MHQACLQPHPLDRPLRVGIHKRFHVTARLDSTHACGRRHVTRARSLMRCFGKVVATSLPNGAGHSSYHPSYQPASSWVQSSYHPSYQPVSSSVQSSYHRSYQPASSSVQSSCCPCCQGLLCHVCCLCCQGPLCHVQSWCCRQTLSFSNLHTMH